MIFNSIGYKATYIYKSYDLCQLNFAEKDAQIWQAGWINSHGLSFYAHSNTLDSLVITKMTQLKEPDVY